MVSKVESTRNVSGWKSGWMAKKSQTMGYREEKLPMDLSSSGESVGKDGELIGITEIPVDVLLLGIRVGCGLGWHEPISHFIWIDIGFILVLGFGVF